MRVERNEQMMGLGELLGKLSSAEINQKVKALDDKKAQKSALRDDVSEHLSDIKSELRKLTLEYQLEESPSALKRIDELKGRAAKLDVQLSQLDEELASIRDARLVLEKKYGPAKNREIQADFKEKCESLLSSHGQRIETLLAALEKEVAAGLLVVEELHGISVPRLTGPFKYQISPRSIWNDAICAGLMVHLKKSFPYIDRLGMDAASADMKSAGGLSSYLKSRLETHQNGLRLSMSSDGDESSVA
jgi:hypothetical protein